METFEAAAHLRLPAAETAPSRARKFVTSTLQGLEVPEDTSYTIALLTSELVTNAVVHGRSDVDLVLHLPGGELTISVCDENPRHPQVGTLDDLGALSGRGTALVASLADEWGVEDLPEGKRVWFKMHVFKAADDREAENLPED